MSVIEAIYHDGVFQPVQDVNLSENQRVRLSVEPVAGDEIAKARQWLADVQEMQKRITPERGYFPDSAASIAEDRMR